MIDKTRHCTIGVMAVLLLGLAVPGVAEPTGVDSEALATLQRMTDHLASLERFEVDAQATLEVVLISGQKLQFDHETTMLLERPNRFKASRRGELDKKALFFDGETLTFFGSDANSYASVEIPGDLEKALDFAHDELDIVAPGSDLFYHDAFDGFIDGVTEGFVVSREAQVEGQRCTHIAFRKPGVDMQFWILDGESPLPLKMVLTTTDLIANPQYMVTMTKWDVDPSFADEVFSFVPPTDAMRIEFLGAMAPSASGE